MDWKQPHATKVKSEVSKEKFLFAFGSPAHSFTNSSKIDEKSSYRLRKFSLEAKNFTAYALSRFLTSLRSDLKNRFFFRDFKLDFRFLGHSFTNWSKNRKSSLKSRKTSIFQIAHQGREEPWQRVCYEIFSRQTRFAEPIARFFVNFGAVCEGMRSGSKRETKFLFGNFAFNFFCMRFSPVDLSIKSAFPVQIWAAKLFFCRF